MIRAIIFDLDGVLIESADIKTRAFRKLFSNYPDNVDELIEYHITNMGLSRYVKFRYFYEKIIRKPYTEERGIDLGKQFSEMVLDEIKDAPLVGGVTCFLENYYQEYLLFIASGTPQSELLEIVSFKGLSKYFRGIFGTPASKTEIVNRILDRYTLDRKEVVFVGDANTDRIAAANTGINFVLRVTPENKSLMASSSYKINDISQLKLECLRF